jgi:sporulation protein YlmC with PRC-barrel domain
MKNALLLGAFAGAVLLANVADAAPLTSAPPDSWTVTNYYKQSVYDGSQNKIGSVDDVLIDKSGKVTGLVLGVGGFLGMGEKDVIVNFSDVHVSKKDNNNWWLTVDETKDSLKAAPGFSYNRETTTWQPAKAS